MAAVLIEAAGLPEEAASLASQPTHFAEVASFDQHVSANATDPAVPAWLPGVGPCCYGVWSARWAGALPANLTARLGGFAPALLRHVRQQKCPYGATLPGSITWPGSVPRELRDVVRPLTFLTFVAVVYSFLPWLVAFIAVVSLLVRRSTRELFIVTWLLLTVIATELVLKPIFGQPRPGTMMQVTDYAGRFVGSCVESCGMPSSHSALAIGWFVLLLCDAMTRVHPAYASFDESLVESLGAEALVAGESARELPETRLGRLAASETPQLERIKMRMRTIAELLVLTPWAPHDTLTHFEFLIFGGFWALVMLPVPFMRVVLYDHSTDQVSVGAAVGALLALLWWRLLRHVQVKLPDLKKVWHFEHNCRTPKFYVYSCAQAANPRVNSDVGLARQPPLSGLA